MGEIREEYWAVARPRYQQGCQARGRIESRHHRAEKRGLEQNSHSGCSPAMRPIECRRVPGMATVCGSGNSKEARQSVAHQELSGPPSDSWQHLELWKKLL